MTNNCKIELSPTCINNADAPESPQCDYFDRDKKRPWRCSFEVNYACTYPKAIALALLEFSKKVLLEEIQND